MAAVSELDASFSSMKVTDVDASSILKRMTVFCEPKGIATNGVLAITMQSNRTGDFCSLIIDMDAGKIEDLYPADDLSDYKEGRAGTGDAHFLFCYHANLDPSKLPSKMLSSETAVQDTNLKVGSPF